MPTRFPNGENHKEPNWAPTRGPGQWRPPSVYIGLGVPLT